VRADIVEERVIEILKTLKPPDDWCEKMINAVSRLLGDKKLDERIAEIKEVINRMDFRWDHGFITDQDGYLEERLRLQQELEQLSPIPDDDLVFAEGLLTNFAEYWETAKEDPEEQERLFQLILVRAWVIDNQVVEICLRPNYHVVLGLDQKRPTEISVDLGKSYQSGSDGIRSISDIMWYYYLSSRRGGEAASSQHLDKKHVLPPASRRASQVTFSLVFVVCQGHHFYPKCLDLSLDSSRRRRFAPYAGSPKVAASHSAIGSMPSEASQSRTHCLMRASLKANHRSRSPG
jgi:hypothetical protein